jgi:hypothetical protein
MRGCDSGQSAASAARGARRQLTPSDLKAIE